MVKISQLSGVAAAALLIGVVGATAQGARDSGAGNTQPSGGGASSAQGSSGSLGASGGASSGGAAGTSAQTGQSRSGASGAQGAGANTQPPGGGASSAQGAAGSVGESGRAGSAQGSSSTQTGSSASAGGAGGGAVTLSSEEQTKLKSSIHNVNVKSANNIHVEVRTGTVLPETVTTELEPIPPSIVEIVPRFRGYKVIKVKNEILIVEPSTRRVVYIIQS